MLILEKLSTENKVHWMVLRLYGIFHLKALKCLLYVSNLVTQYFSCLSPIVKSI